MVNAQKSKAPFVAAVLYLVPILVSFLMLSLIGTSSWARPSQPEVYVRGEFLVQLKMKNKSYESRELEKRFKARILSEIRPDLLLIKRDLGEAVDFVLNDLRAAPEVRLVEPNYIYRTFKAPNDPDYAKLWGLKNSGSIDASGLRGLTGVDIGAEKAWALTTGSKNIVVAVIDTGVDFSHPDLKNNAWVNEAEANGQTGIDDDANGFIDDINGYDFVKNSGASIDPFGHGTHCAGTIGAEGDNGIGVVGVAWNVSIMNVRFLNERGGGTLEAAIRAIDYSVKMGAKISSNSWGGNLNSELLKQAIERGMTAGQLFIAAAGNEARDHDIRPTYPAGFDLANIVAVAAVNNRGELASFSNWGAKSVHVAAPGMNILSTVPGGRMDTYSGTSMAAPHVSGLSALLWGANSHFTYAEVKERLMTSSRTLKVLTGKVRSGGIVDAYFALTGETPPNDPHDPSLWLESVPQEISTPHPYTNDLEQTFTVSVPGARRMAVHFAKFSTENRYDKVTFFNGAGEKLGEMSGEQSDRFSPIADGDTIVLKFKSDKTKEGYGFDVDKAVFER